MTRQDRTTDAPLVVTGGAGFVGSALVRNIVRHSPLHVVNVDKLTYAGNVESLGEVMSTPRHRFEELDICDGPALRSVLNLSQPGAIVLLAAESHVAALLTILERGKPGESYNIGGHAERSNIDLVRAICRLLDELLPNAPHRPHESLIEFVEDRPGHDFRYALDTSKIESQLGWKPHETFESGLRRTIEWYLDNAQWCRRVQDGSYRGQRLGLETA